MQTCSTCTDDAQDNSSPEDPDFEDVIREFPRMRHAFAYGSGVFLQPGLYEKGKEEAMIDFIFAVEDPASWHHMVSRVGHFPV